jgi:DNA-binding winged helix-turn-helix (wHTH) protein
MLVRLLASAWHWFYDSDMTVDLPVRNPERWLHAVPDGGPLAILVLTDGLEVDRGELERLAADLSRSLRRSRQSVEPAAPDAAAPRSVYLDHSARRLVLGTTEVPLTHLEFELLAYLVRNQSRAVTRSELLERVWNYATAAGDRTVDVHVRRLRRKLAGAWTLTTVRGYGYRFDGWHETVAATPSW